jgi:RHS repeat-associated protein
MTDIISLLQNTATKSESLKYFYNDNLGSRRVAINNSGVKLDLFTYSTWGAVSHTDSYGYLSAFTGKGYDDTRLIYFNARYYDPIIARFISEDPAKQGISWSTYCANNPINRVDEDGRNDKSDAIAQTMVNAENQIVKKLENMQKAELLI